MGYELCQKVIDLNRSLGYGAFLCLRVWLNFYCKINSIILSRINRKFLIAATPGPDLTLREYGRYDIFGVSCSEQ